MTIQTPHQEALRHSLDGAVLTATLPLSSDGLLSLRACDELAQLLSSPPEAASVVVLTSDRAQFCLGRERTAVSVEELPSEVDRLVAVNSALRSTRLVSVARVHGDAAGFGVGLAALSDFAVASSDASFWFPEVNIDLAPFLVLAWLPQLVGRREALHLAVTGEHIDAHRALEIGIVSEVAPEAELDARVATIIGGLRGRNPRVLAEIRDFLRVTDQAPEVQATELARARLVVGSLRRAVPSDRTAPAP